MSHSLDELLSLAQKQFGQLTNAEKKLFYAIAHDEVANFQTGIEKLDRPIKAKHWEAERTLKADRIVWLVTNEAASKFISFRGLRIIGAKIEGSIDLKYANVSIPLTLEFCALTDTLMLEKARLRGLYLQGTHITATPDKAAIQANEMRIEDTISLCNHFIAWGKISLVGAIIEGDLDCIKGKLINPNQVALDADQAKISGQIYFNNEFIAKGKVRLRGATIGGILQCERGRFYKPNGKALNAERANIAGHVFLGKQFKAKGEVRLLGTTIGGNLECSQGQFCNPPGIALNAENTNVIGSVVLRNGFKAEGEVSLLGATIGGNLECDRGQFCNQPGIALSAARASISGSVFLRNEFKSEGEVRLVGTLIGRTFDCTGGQFLNPGRVAIYASRVKITDTVFLDQGFEAQGCVRLIGAAIGGGLISRGGRFFNPGQDEQGNAACAIDAEGLTVEGSVCWINQFQAIGKVDLVNARIDDTLRIENIAHPEQMSLDLSFAKIGTLADSEQSWTTEGNLCLNGFTYNALDVRSLLDGKRRLKWIRLQPDDEYALQPYEQLAAVLRASGHQQAATEILIGKEEDRRRYGGLSPLGKAWNWFLGVTIAHGYRPEKALYYSLPLIMLGALLFGQGYQAKLISETVIEPYAAGTRVDPNLYPAFNPVLYSIDVFLPVIDFHQETYWIPNPSRVGEVDLLLLKTQMSGRLLLYYFWLQIVAGWVLTSLWIAGFTGLVRSQQ